MRILWVTVDGLWPLDSGARLRSFHIIAELARRHRLTLLTARGAGDDPAELAARLRECEEVKSVPYAIPKQGSARFVLALLRSWLSPLPVDIRKCRVPALVKEVSRRIAAGSVDVCVVDFLRSTLNAPLDGPAPVILFAHNVEHMIWKRMSRVEPRMWRRALLELEYRKMRRYEAQACARAKLTVAVSDVDRARLAAEAPTAVVRAIPTGVDASYFRPNGTRERATELVFTGSLDWYPNEDAVLHFVDAILPRIRREVPDASLTVAGRNPTSRLRARAAAAGVRVTGTVDDVRPFVHEAAVFVVPLRVGGGTRLKIFEALAMRKAVVSTTVGAEGLPLTPGEHFLQADDPGDFANHVIGLLRAPERRRALGATGRRLVEERYSWAQVAREFEARCEEVVGRHAR